MDDRMESEVLMQFDVSAQSRKSLENLRKSKEITKKVKGLTDQCVKYIEKNNSKQLINFISKMDDNIKLNQLVDNDGFSLLHMAVFKNKQKSFDQLLVKAKEDISPQELTEWVNLKTTKD